MEQKEKSSKKKFIIAFLEAVDIRNGPFSLFARESWHYKDLRMAGFDPKEIYKKSNNLKDRGILRSDTTGRFKFTNQGKLWAKQSVQRYFPLRPQKWDKKWRVVIFDIPQDLHLVRIKLARKLKQTGFYMLQKSVFVFPYPCKEDLGYLCEKLGVSDYVDVITAEDVGFKESELKKYYDL